ncbi:ABC transporter substrate-binding protein [Arthrobacter halodurans]|uniref:ABC transporter substrate-binding protein n=1 Tax=Arthrobacter halodurans TaxID=516699 RepID=A0ABV4UQ45_9MICC
MRSRTDRHRALKRSFRAVFPGRVVRRLRRPLPGGRLRCREPDLGWAQRRLPRAHGAVRERPGGTTTPIAAGSTAEAGVPLKVIGAEFQKNPIAAHWLADEPHENSGGLVGQRIGAADCTDETRCAALLTVNRMGPSEVEKVPAQFDPHPLMNGEVDGQIDLLPNEVTPPRAQGARRGVHALRRPRPAVRRRGVRHHRGELRDLSRRAHGIADRHRRGGEGGREGRPHGLRRGPPARPTGRAGRPRAEPARVKRGRRRRAPWPSARRRKRASGS